jgi:Ca-activated chloride channel family protein
MTRSTILGIIVFSPCLFAFQRSSPQVAVSIEPRMNLKTTPEAARYPEARLRIDSALALIPVHVTTAEGTTVTNLERGNFEIFEDGVEQKITTFSKDDAPVSIGLVFDTSGSMINKMRKSAAAVTKFFQTANNGDEFFLVEFSDRPKLSVSLTPDYELISRRISRTRPFGRTSLLDAIHLAMMQMKSAHNLRKALVILSDGGDNRSRFTAGEIKNTMLESDVQLYAMGIFDMDDMHKHPIEEQNGPQLLEDLADQTGGRMFTLANPDQLEPVSERISHELRNQYLLGYSPSDGDRDGKYRRVKVQLNAPDLPNLRTYFRHGYYAPAQ